MAAQHANQRPSGTTDAAGAARVDAAVGRALAAGGPVALAVSGGRDSMVLLHAAARLAPGRVALVATFDHRSGAHATEAAALVERTGRALGFAVAVGEAAGRVDPTEAGWRTARWAFLRRAAGDAGARVIATAHTEDDQVETVFMRALRGAGARGLAGLYAAGPVLRPLVEVTRADVAAYAEGHGVSWVADPTNRSRRYLRNRVRHELLPAAARARPGFRDELLALARRAAVLRAEVEAVAATLVSRDRSSGVAAVPVAALAGLGEEALAMLWPALAARAGVTLDRRGTVRLARFTISGRSGQVVPVSGGATLLRTRDELILRGATPAVHLGRPEPAAGLQPLGDAVRVGAFGFRRAAGGVAGGGGGGDLWSAEFDRGAVVAVRRWAPGDRMHEWAGGPARRVKRYLADAHVPAFDRAGWPVVLVNGAIAWIPGVRRSDAATVRPGRPGVRYECDRIDG